MAGELPLAGLGILIAPGAGISQKRRVLLSTIAAGLGATLCDSDSPQAPGIIVAAPNLRDDQLPHQVSSRHLQAPCPFVPALFALTCGWFGKCSTNSIQSTLSATNG